MNKKKTIEFLQIKKVSLLSLFAFIIFLLMSCGNNKSDQPVVSKDTDNAVKPTLAPKKTNAPVFKLPVFDVSRTEIEKYYGTGKKNPKKFLIRIEFGDITELEMQNSKLLLYPAKDHKEYAAKQKPLEIPATESFSAEMNSNVIIGTNEFDGSEKLYKGNVLKSFETLRFTPKLIAGEDGRTNHLSYNVSLITAEKAVEDLGDANPSPPKAPGYN